MRINFNFPPETKSVTGTSPDLRKTIPHDQWKEWLGVRFFHDVLSVKTRWRIKDFWLLSVSTKWQKNKHKKNTKTTREASIFFHLGIFNSDFIKTFLFSLRKGAAHAPQGVRTVPLHPHLVSRLWTGWVSRTWSGLWRDAGMPPTAGQPSCTTPAVPPACTQKAVEGYTVPKPGSALYTTDCCAACLRDYCCPEHLYAQTRDGRRHVYSEYTGYTLMKISTILSLHIFNCIIYREKATLRLQISMAHTVKSSTVK